MSLYLSSAERQSRSVGLIVGIVALVWATVVYYLSTLSMFEIQEIVALQVNDKLAHLSMFAIGGALITTALGLVTSWKMDKVVLCSVVILSLFGLADEVRQLATPGRTGSNPLDWAADTVGAIFGTLVAAYFLFRRYRRITPPAFSRSTILRANEAMMLRGQRGASIWSEARAPRVDRARIERAFNEAARRTFDRAW